MPPATPSLDTIVGDAAEIPDPAARAAYLVRACGPDHALRRRAEALVAAHFRAGGRFLEPPAAAPDLTAAFAPGPDGPPGPDVGAVIGPYALREVIGEGGMGLVFAAEQTHPVRRRVALKVIKPGMDTRQVVARFEAERQALALMDHPNIARVLDAGATPDGRPYFVMELVKGTPVTDYCDARKLTVRDRLGLFLQVCGAVQHAHQKGVIHRDIKPSNVLVAVHDVTPVAKVIDFGIAKAVGQSLTDKTVYTGVAQLIGTPLYMSPEQAGQSSLDVDTRTDVYALGVLLYELLTGTTPIDPEAIRRAGYDELRRVIREDEPARPSARLSTLDAAARSTVADRRGADPRVLARAVRGELDWVAMRCLEKDRARRYESVSALAADVRRYLADEPVAACPPSVGYRVRKFARRNRAALASAAVLAVALAAAAGGLGWAAWDAAARRASAEGAASGALAESADHHRGGRPDAAMSSARRAADLLAGVPRAGRVFAEAQARVAELEMAARLENLRLAGVEAGNYTGAEAGAAAHEAAFREFGIDPAALTDDGAAARVRGRLVTPELVAGLDKWDAEQRGEYGPSDPLAARLRAIADAADADPWSRRARALNLDGTPDQLSAAAAEIPVEDVSPWVTERFARALARSGRRGEAEALLRRAARVHPGHVGVNFGLGDLLRTSPSATDRVEGLGFYRAALAARPGSAAILDRVGVTLTDSLNRPAEGEQVFRDIIRRRPDHILARRNLGVALRKQGRQAEAVSAAREAVAVAPGVHTHLQLGVELGLLGRPGEAAEAYRAAVGVPPRTAEEHLSRAAALRALGRGAEALAACREAALLRPTYAYAHHCLGTELDQARQAGAALAAYREALRLDPERADTHTSVGSVLRRLGRPEEALAASREAVRLEPENFVYRLNLAHVLENLRRWDEMTAEYREAIRLKPDSADAHYNLGNSLNAAGRVDDAIEAHRQAIRLRPGYAQAHCNLGSIFYRRGQYAEAAECYRKGHEYGSKDPGWPYPSGVWLDNARRLAALEPRLPAILAGTELPADPADIAVAGSAAADQKRYARAAELYRAAFERAPPLADDPKGGRRYGAALAAARAGCGLGQDAAGLDADARAGWRRQALAWLTADLAAWGGRLSGPDATDRQAAHLKLRNAVTDRDLACVRDPAELAKLPAGEAAGWAAFWAEAKALLAGPPTSAGKK